MSFCVNVDKPTKRATIHTFISSDPRCQPQDKQSQDGDWLGPIDTKQEAIEAAEEAGLNVHLCGVCNP